MPEVVYPTHMYRDLNRPRYAHDRKAVDALTLEGWTDIRANIGPQLYPCSLYRADGVTQVVGDYDKEGVVDLAAAQAKEKELTDAGWSRTAVAKIEEEAKPPLSFTEAVNEAAKGTVRVEKVEQAVAVLGSDVEALKSDTAELKSGVAEILALLTKPPKEPKPPKD